MERSGAPGEQERKQCKRVFICCVLTVVGAYATLFAIMFLVLKRYATPELSTFEINTVSVSNATFSADHQRLKANWDIALSAKNPKYNKPFFYSKITADALQFGRKIVTLTSSVVSPNSVEHGGGKEIFFHVRFEDMSVDLNGGSAVPMGFVEYISFRVEVGTARYEGDETETRVMIGCEELGLVVSPDEEQVSIVIGGRRCKVDGIKWDVQKRKYDRIALGFLLGICLISLLAMIMIWVFPLEPASQG